MKKVTVLMGMLLALGLSSACSGDGEMSALMGEKLSLFEDSTQIIPENDYTGSLFYDSRYGWYIQYSQPIDRVDKYFPVNLPDEINKEGTVSFSGRVVKMTKEEMESLQIPIPWSGETYYFIYLTKIEIVDKQIDIPYRGNPPFTITDMPGTVGYNMDSQVWSINYAASGRLWNTYYPKEISDEFKVVGMKVVISGNVYEEMTDTERNYWNKEYKIELTKIEKAE
jgi:hypothetical protein